MSEVCISGVSGRFPSASNISDLSSALFSGTDLVSPHHRWPPSLALPQRMGQIPDLALFDASFFGINPKQAHSMDPKLRKLIEATYEAIADAGINPTSLRGSPTGVFLGVSPETRDAQAGSGLLTRSGALLANTLSFTLDFHGPSFALDTACSSGLYALDQAVAAITNGSCTAAIVCAAQTHLDPTQTKELLQLGVLNSDGKCKSFDSARNGYVKSEAVVALLLQKQQECKRIYAKVLASGSNADGFKSDGISRPSTNMQVSLLESIYTKNKIDKNRVSYVETHGPGTVVGDREEARALSRFFCSSTRKNKLLIGAVKSNLGHTETASGLVSVAKILISINTGTIPANLHYTKTSREDIPEVDDVFLKVVTCNTPYEGGYFAINAFGFGGANSHVVLEPHKPRTITPQKPVLRLVVVSSRTKQGVVELLEFVQEHRTNSDFLALIDSVFTTQNNNTFRGFTVLGSGENHERIFTSCVKQQKRPVYFSFSGMGSQWPGMGADLVKLPTFAKTLKKCSQALAVHGLDLENIVVNGTEATFEDVRNCFPAIVAISVGLVDLLREIGVEADKIFGHSLGEIACGYADGSLTAEQAVLVAFARGHVSHEIDDGAKNSLMASVGLSREDCQTLLPQDVAIACDNSCDNVTVAGPEESIKNFLGVLEKKKVFAKIVPTGKIAFHCKHISGGEKPLLDFLQSVIPSPKKRSEKWLSTSVAEENWKSPLAEYNSAEYHTNNFLNQVKFRQVLEKIPSDAVVVEIAPRGLLQAVLRRNLPSSTARYYLVERGASNNCAFFYETAGKLFLEGVDVDLTKVETNKKCFPVAVSTPTLSNLIKWDHGRNWTVPRFNPVSAFGKRFEIDVAEEAFAFLAGHCVNGKILYPAAGYLFLVWETFAEMVEEHHDSLSVLFENVKIVQGVVLKPHAEVCLTVNIFQSSGRFEISSERALIATGTVAKSDITLHIPKKYKDYDDSSTINREDFFKEYNLRGYNYSGAFCEHISAEMSGKSAEIEWTGNWVTFIDAILNHHSFFFEENLWVPTDIEQIVINPHIRPEKVNLLSYSQKFKMAEMAGIKMRGIRGKNIPNSNRRSNVASTLQKYEFIPESTQTKFNENSLMFSLRISLGIVLENSPFSNLKIAIMRNSQVTAEQIKQAVSRNITFNPTIKEIASVNELETYFDLVVLEKDACEMSVLTAVTAANFIFATNCATNNTNLVKIYRHLDTESDNSFELIRRKRQIYTGHVIMASNTQLDWIEELKMALNQTSHHYRVYLYSSEACSGIIGMYNTLRLENVNCQNLRIVNVAEETASATFSLTSNFYRDQLEKDLAINYFQNGCWGTFRLLPTDEIKTILTNNAIFLHDKTWIENYPPYSRDSIQIYYANMAENSEMNGFAGIAPSSGEERIMGIVERRSLVTQLDLGDNKTLSWKIPETWSVEDGATVPLIYSLAYYELFVKNRLSVSDRLLVCQAETLFSQAVIRYALYINCKLFCIVSNREKRDYLLATFQDLIADNEIFVYPSEDFAEFHPQSINAIINCQNTSDLSVFKQLSHVSNPIQIDYQPDRTLRHIFSETNEKQRVHRGIAEFLEKNVIKPFEYRIFNVNNFKKEEENRASLVRVLNASNSKIPALIRTYFDADKTYIVVGGLGGVGFELANWIVTRHARKVVLNARHAPSSSYHKHVLRKWRLNGVQTVINLSDTTKLEGARELIRVGEEIGSIGGIFHASLVLKDALFAEMSQSELGDVIASKVYSVANLDEAAQKCSLEYFVAFSSLVCSVGHEKQSNYGYANFALERICANRRRKGLAGLAVEWGPIGDVGFYAKQRAWRSRKILNAVPQPISSCFETFERLLRCQKSDVTACCVFSEEEKKELEEKSLTEKILKCFGIRNSDEIDSTATLMSLGMDSLLTYEISSILFQECRVKMAAEAIKAMTVGELRRICNDTPLELTRV